MPCATSCPLGAIVATLLLLIVVLKRIRPVSKHRDLNRRLPPGPATLPVIGNLHQVIWNKPTVYRWVHRLLEEMGTDVLCLRLGPVSAVVVACPEVAREVLWKKDAVFASRPTTFATCLFSFGYKGSILTPHGEQWKKMRRVLVSEILSPSMEQGLRHLRDEESDLLVNHIYASCTAGAAAVVDVRHAAQSFCGNTVRRLSFGKRFFGDTMASPAAGAPGHDEVAHVDALLALLNSIYSFSVSNYFPALVGLDFDGHEKAVRGIIRTLNRLHDPIIEERIHDYAALRERGEKRQARDYLDVLVSIADSDGLPLLSIDEIRAQILEIMFAVVDNPSNAVEWALAEMMNKPEIMKRATDELDVVVGREKLVQESDVPRLNYLKSCMRESLRVHPYHALHPPRVAMESTTISGYTVPKGSHVILSRVGLGRNPKIWAEPLKFRPERHLSDAGDVGLSETGLRFISFSTGRRGCPGISLGTSITMMLFARMLQGFTWMEPPGVGKISLEESKLGLSLAQPLLLQAKPRLAACLYKGN